MPMLHHGKMVEKMITTKKEKIMGAEMTFVRDPVQAWQAFFDVKESQPKTIVMHTEQYRQYVKKQVIESRGIKWGAITTGAKKEQLFLRKIKERHEKGGYFKCL